MRGSAQHRRSFVGFDSLRPSQKFSVMSGRVFLGQTNTKQRIYRRSSLAVRSSVNASSDKINLVPLVNCACTFKARHYTNHMRSSHYARA